MGNLEKRVAVKVRNTKVQRAILNAVAVAGMLGIALVAPNTLSVLGRTINRFNTKNVRNATKRLAERGLLRVQKRGEHVFYEITNAGNALLDKSKTYTVSKPKRWDGKWRLVSFDISQARSAQRTRLRQTLREIGFERLQDSVWVFPYDCEDLIALLKADYGLGKEVLYIIADTIENDRALRGRFGLKRR